MLLAIDIGNSNIVFGLFFEEKWQHQWRIQTAIKNHLVDEKAAIYDQFLKQGLAVNEVEKVIISSVVPTRTASLINILENLFTNKISVINESAYSNLPLTILNPKEIGTDLVANAVAGYTRYHGNACTIVDFGTALTHTTISAQGEILGVTIAPGLKTSIRSLFLNTAQLPDVPLTYPDSALGLNTNHAIQSGVLIGYTGMVKFMIEQIKSELKTKGITNHFVIATGGLSSVLPPLKKIFDDIDPMLTLDGIRLISDYTTT